MHLLFVANYEPDTGYAWTTIEAVFRRLGEALAARGVRVTIAYSALPNGPPANMRGAPINVIAFDYERVTTRAGLQEFLALLKAQRVTALYLTDRTTWSWRYGRYRRAGVRHIFLHERTSGERTRRTGLLRTLKTMLHRASATRADCYIAVSDFVRRRLIASSCTPPEHTHLVYNGIDFAPFDAPARTRLRTLIGASQETTLVFCSGRAQPYKGVQVLIDAIALLTREGLDIGLVYCGDGAYLDTLRAQAATLGLANVHLLGRRSDVPDLLGAADIAVVPSLWAEAFGLTVVEAMAAGAPLIATRTGGITELVEEGVTGLLVDPGDARQLADALRQLVAHPERARRMAARANAAARQRFSIDRVTADLLAVVQRELGLQAPQATRDARADVLASAYSAS